MDSRTRNTRSPFVLIDVARVTGGRIVQVHANWCPSLHDGGRCTCDEVSYRIVTTKGAK
jgi:hypothetical protein